MLITRENCRPFLAAVCGFAVVQSDLHVLCELVRREGVCPETIEGFELLRNKLVVLQDRVEQSVGYDKYQLIAACLDAMGVTLSVATNGPTTAGMGAMDALSMAVRSEASRVVLRNMFAEHYSKRCGALADAVLALGVLPTWQADPEHGMFLNHIADQMREAALSLIWNI